ncbi:MAG: hypothetical protein KA375_08970 [Vitreoscilla sp.]|nr:hypothetical protein [Vitreoscilla sp.]
MLAPDDPLNLALLRIADRCEGLQGAALTTADGKVLAACGDLMPKAVATQAAGLPAQLDEQLGLICLGRVQEALVWTDTGPWYLCRIDDAGHALVLKAGPIEHAAMLRQAGGLAAHRIERLLSAMVTA